MRLVYYASDGTPHLISSVVSWCIVIGAGYGLVRLVVDVLRMANAEASRRAEQRRAAASNATAPPPIPPGSHR